MPHQCTNCGHTFPDGSKEMLSGCPNCGGNKFQFKPATSNDTSSTTDSSTPDQTATDSSTPDQTATDSSAVDSTPPESASNTARSEQSSATRQTSPAETKGVSDESEAGSDETVDSLDHSGESPAQSTARSEVVSSSELTAAGKTAHTSDSETDADPNPTAGSAGEQPTPSSDRPTADAGEESSLDQLRKELNDQFESIRIVSPGQYELNLMELYDREEYIISLREDGRYVIEVPDGWGDS